MMMIMHHGLTATNHYLITLQFSLLCYVPEYIHPYLHVCMHFQSIELLYGIPG